MTKPGVVGSNPAALTATQQCASTENHSTNSSRTAPNTGHTSGACSGDVHPALQGADCTIPVRRCAGLPGVWTCEAVLGPEVQGELCAHCAAAIAHVHTQEDAASEAFVDCDGCQPDRRPLSGKLCGRCSRLARERRTGGDLADSQRGDLAKLISDGFLTVPEVDEIQGALRGFATVLDVTLSGMSTPQAAAFLALLEEFVSQCRGVAQ